MSDQKTPATPSSRPTWLTNRVIGGIAIGLLLLIFIALNRQHTKVSFIVFSTETSLWIALALAGGAGFLAGYLVGKRRYRQ